MRVAVIGSGPSLTDEQIYLVEQARNDGRLGCVIAISNVGLDKTPWADALVSHDDAWWRYHRSSFSFHGKKFCRHLVNSKMEKFVPSFKNGCSSGLMAMEIADKIYEASQIILLGFDMHSGDGQLHYFGKHPHGLRNTTNDKFRFHISQFEDWLGPPVYNATPNSALKKFPLVNLHDIL